MSAGTKARLTPRQRLTRGLTYTAVGPIDVTRGVMGLGYHSAQVGASNLRCRYRKGRATPDVRAAQKTVAQEVAAAREVAAGLPQALREARRARHRGIRPWVIAGSVVTALTGGAIAFSIIRRSSRPEPSPRPPSVDVQPRP